MDKARATEFCPQVVFETSRTVLETISPCSMDSCMLVRRRLHLRSD